MTKAPEKITYNVGYGVTYEGEDGSRGYVYTRSDLADAAYERGRIAGLRQAADRTDRGIAGKRSRLERWGQHLSDTKTPSISYAIEKADLDARVSCRDQVLALIPDAQEDKT